MEAFCCCAVWGSVVTVYVSGRGLWAMGSKITEERRLFAALNNCAFVSTAVMNSSGKAVDPVEPYCFLMDAAMLGVGVGFDTVGSAGTH